MLSVLHAHVSYASSESCGRSVPAKSVFSCPTHRFRGVASVAHSRCAQRGRDVGRTLYAVYGDQNVARDVQQLDEAEAERRVAKAVGLIQTADELAPYDRVGFCAALVIW